MNLRKSWLLVVGGLVFALNPLASPSSFANETTPANESKVPNEIKTPESKTIEGKGVEPKIAENHPSPLPSKKPVNKAQLLKEYIHAQVSELKALDHQRKLDLKELSVSQNAKQREWKRSEETARHKFFEEHPKGAERRVYVQDFQKRRDAFLAELAQEKTDKAKEYEDKIRQLKIRQANQYKLFKQMLDKGEQPTAELWPKVGT